MGPVSDLFSLGCLLYRVATGKLPFPGTTVTQQLTALVSLLICGGLFVAMFGNLGTDRSNDTGAETPPVDGKLAGPPVPDPSPQIEHAKSELLRLNPGMIDAAQFDVVDGVVRKWQTDSKIVRDIAPLAVFTELETVRIIYGGFGVRRELDDLSPLAGMTKLNSVAVEQCPRLVDITPLRGKPLVALSLYRSPVPEDLSWVTSSRIERLNLGGRDESVDLSFVKAAANSSGWR